MKLNSHEQACLDNAEHFTAVRGLGRLRSVQRCETLAEAEGVAATYGDGKTMIYAVTAQGSAGHIKNA